MTDTETSVPVSIEMEAALAGVEFAADPYPSYARLREHSGWLAPSRYRVYSSFEDVLQILRQPDVFGQERVPYPNFHTSDPPEHTRLRRLVAKAFTAHSVRLLRERIDEIVVTILDDLAGRTEFDLVEDIAMRLSAAVMAEILGVPESDAAQWHHWMHELARFRGVTRFFPLETSTDTGALDAAKQASSDMAAYMGRLIESQRSVRDGGIVSGLFAARERDDSLTEAEILYALILLVGAGLHTTAGQLSNTYRAVLSRPAIAAELRVDPDLVPNAVEEALRYEGALQAEYRVVRIDVELAGAQLHAGDHVIVVNGAANHDPAMFTRPEEFDIHRENARRHLTFGFGIHHCLGAELARTQLDTAIRRTLERYPNIVLTGPGTQNGWDRWRGLTSLPARVGPSVSNGVDA